MASALAACQGTEGPARPTLLTVADFEALLATADASTTVASGHGVPGGIPLRRIIGRAADETATLALRDTFTETYHSGYLTTELWTGYDQVWVQPMYVAVSGYGPDGSPTIIGGAAGWRPIFGVGTGSAFYSPYWQRIDFEVPPGDDVSSFRSVRDVVDRGMNLRPAGDYLAVLAPESVGLPARIPTPSAGSPGVGGPGRGTGLIDGADAPFLDFGSGTFTWDADLVVEEAPIFVWVVRDSSGALQTLDIPTVGGTGPLYAKRPPKIVNGKPLYGSYWRLYTVELQPGMGVFAPPGLADVRAGIAATPYLSFDMDYGPTVLTPPNPASLTPWVGRVTQNPACFGDIANLDPTNGSANPCVYLDSQAAIEALIPSVAIQRTDIVVTCPFITYDNLAVVSP